MAEGERDGRLPAHLGSFDRPSPVARRWRYVSALILVEAACSAPADETAAPSAPGSVDTGENCDATYDGPRCGGSSQLSCSSGHVWSYDFGQDGQQCRLDSSGHGYCTAACPANLDSKGRCEGSRLLKCDGAGVYIDYDCAQDGKGCLLDANGAAWCSFPCPPGVDAFGSCLGEVARYCDGQTYYSTDCATTGATCEQINRFGVGCRGCGAAPVDGVCSPEGVATGCGNNGTVYRSACVGQSQTCGYDATRCQDSCLTQPSSSCADQGLKIGESKCRTDPTYGFASVVSCASDGLHEQECPAATDGSVTCSTTSGSAACVVDCKGRSGMCSDRGVAVACLAGGNFGWTDCAAYGATCVEGVSDAYCSCTTLSPAVSRCSFGFRASCENGRLVTEACTCEPPDAGSDAGGTPALIPCSASKPCAGGNVCASYGGQQFCSTWCDAANPSSCGATMRCTADPGASTGVCVPK